jgi:hypothetical protein
MLVVTPGHGVAMQYRSTAGGASQQVRAVSGTAPEWVRLTRIGNTFTGYASENGTTWRTIGSVTITMAGDAYVGMPVTSHDDTTLATAFFESVSLTR